MAFRRCRAVCCIPSLFLDNGGREAAVYLNWSFKNDRSLRYRFGTDRTVAQPKRLEYFDPDLIWNELNPDPAVTLVDIGSGVGYVTLPFARRYPDAAVIGCDILEGMVALLRDSAAEEGLGNITVHHMAPGAVPLQDDSADIVVMAQVHHELDAPEPLLADCRWVLRPGDTIAIVD